MNKKITGFSLLLSLAIIIIAVTTLFVRCNHQPALQGKRNGEPFRVAVLHTYGEDMKCYAEYDHAIADNFRKKGLNVDIINYYINARKASYYPNDSCRHILEKVIAEKVDLMITEGNTGLMPLMYELQAIDSVSCPPIIMGGVTTPIWEFIDKLPRVVCVWEDRPNMARICQIAAELSGKNFVQIELDYGLGEDELRHLLNTTITEPQFVNETDRHHMQALTEEGRRAAYPGRIVVTTLAMADVDQNTVEDDSISPFEFTRNAIYECIHYPQVAIKKSMYSDDLIYKTNKPQFTVLPYEFGEENTRFLAAYMVPMRRQAADVVGTATDILCGRSERINRVMRHQHDAFVDYNALKLWNLRYEDVKDRYTVVNVPLTVLSPNQTLIQNIVLVVLIGLTFTALFIIIYIIRKRKLEKRFLNLKPQTVLLLGDNAHYFRYNTSDTFYTLEMWDPITQNMTAQTRKKDDFYTTIHPDDKDNAMLLAQNMYKSGEYAIEMRHSHDNGRTYNWYMHRFVVQNVKGNIYKVKGVTYCTEREHETNDRLANMQKHADEMRKKEKFLSSMNHEIRTPLNSILGFSQILCSSDVNYADDERIEICKAIHLHAHQLLELMQEVLNFNRIESGRSMVCLAPTLVEDFMLGIAAEWRAKFSEQLIDENETDKTGRLQFTFQEGPYGNIVMIDQSYMLQVISQLMTNAIKYTSQGEIRCGWITHIQDNTVEIYIQDSGIGIPLDIQKEAFKLFWKNNSLDRGVGLGLSIAHRMVKAMDGNISIDSYPGRGTKVSIILPIVSPDDLNK